MLVNNLVDPRFGEDEMAPIFGIVAGRSGELSDIGHILVNTIAEARVNKLNLAWPGTGGRMLRSPDWRMKLA